ncbi:MAG TPA: hypothetical protein VFK43_07810, partial [Acidimicrobiales bacterium]|nr:hypothetical protein [Acidimicrobiales bacterium]
VPTPGAVVVGALLAALGALFVIVLAHPAPASAAPWTIEPGHERFPRQLVPSAAGAWRAPPLPARA